MKITVLGSGTSSGVPIVGCPCAICHSTNTKNQRLRSSCLFEVDEKIILIDTGPDLRAQALANNILRVDAVLYTHIHADHVHGIDELRVYNALQKKALPIYGNSATLEHLKKCFSYVFRSPDSYPSLIPTLDPHVIDGPFDCEGVEITPIPCEHGKNYITMNYRIGGAAWLTDTSGIPEASMENLKGLDVLFLDGLRIKPHPTHLHLEESIKLAQKIGAKKTYLIHLTHDYDHDEFNKTLPEDIQLAYDGLVVDV